MAKKSTKKVEKEAKVIENISSVVNEEISDILEKVENFNPSDEMVNNIINEEPQKIQEVFEKELEKINSLQQEVENKINEVIKSNPSVVNVMKKSNTTFTNIWNGMITE